MTLQHGFVVVPIVLIALINVGSMSISSSEYTKCYDSEFLCTEGNLFKIPCEKRYATGLNYLRWNGYTFKEDNSVKTI